MYNYYRYLLKLLIHYNVLFVVINIIADNKTNFIIIIINGF